MRGPGCYSRIGKRGARLRGFDKAIVGIEDRFKAKDFKPTMGDYLKLLQMEIDLEQEEIKEIKVTWVEPSVTPGSPE